jgi:hypothetical protein
MAARIRQAAECAPKTTDEGFRELLSEVQFYLYNVNDTAFSQLTGWQNKAVWLTIVGLMLIVTLSIAADHWTLFIVGAAGGFLSRMSQQLKRADVPTDYGASWSTLFLSPVLGSLSGWFGVLLIHFASEPQFGLLGGPLKQIRWDDPCAPGTLVGAFLLGFSERLFDSIVQKLETQIDKQDEAAKRPPQTPLPLPKGGSGPISPKQSAPGGVVTVTLATLDSAKVTKAVLIGADGKEISVGELSKPSPTSIAFAAPRAPKGAYQVRVFAPDPTDAGVLELTDPAPLTIVTPPALPHGAVGQRYTQTLHAAGGTAPYQWAAAGAPPWLNLEPTSGVLGGTPPVAAAGVKFNVKVTDSAGHSAGKDMELTVD